MKIICTDPTAGERARSIVEGTDHPFEITDPTAGSTAAAIRHAPAHELPATDPTDPRWGLPVSDR